MPIFDTCVITASDQRQAGVFSRLLERRLESGLYPREIDFRVYSDPPAGRAGSGGGTVWALLTLLRDDGLDLMRGRGVSKVDQAAERLSARQILIIHAGGESRRLPCYVPEGKLFAPLPVPSGSMVPPVVLDVLLTLFLKYPWRDGELLVTSGDALVDFETGLLTIPQASVCGFSAPGTFETGSRHGVFAFDAATGAVRDYLQKAPPGLLAREAAIEGMQRCAVDLGPVSFRGRGLRSLLESATTPCERGTLADLLERGQAPFDLYDELLTGCVCGLDKEEYLSRLVGRSALSKDLLTMLFESFHPCGLSAVLVKEALFVHFGSLTEFPDACRELLVRGLRPFYAAEKGRPVRESSASPRPFNSIDVHVEPGSGEISVEDCRGVRVSCEGENLVAGVRDLTLSGTLPRGFCIDERRFVDRGSAVTVRLVYHREDSFKAQKSQDAMTFCGVRLTDWLIERGLSREEVFRSGMTTDLYAAELFPAGAGPDQLEGYWKKPADEAVWRKWFRMSHRYSLASANERTDAVRRDAERAEARAAAGEGENGDR